MSPDLPQLAIGFRRRSVLSPSGALSETADFLLLHLTFETAASRGITLSRATLPELLCYTAPLSETPLAEGLTTETGERRSCLSPRAIQWVGLSGGGPQRAVKSKARLRSRNELHGPETLRPQSAWADECQLIAKQ